MNVEEAAALVRELREVAQEERDYKLETHQEHGDAFWSDLADRAADAIGELCLQKEIALIK